MILQNIVFQGQCQTLNRLFLRCSKEVKFVNQQVLIPKNELISTDTYMNIFDIETWTKYCHVTQLAVHLIIDGICEVKLIREEKDGVKDIIVNKYHSRTTCEETIRIPFPSDWENGMVYLEIRAVEDTKIWNCYIDAKDLAYKDIKLSVVICTYRREKQLENLIFVLNNYMKMTNEKTINIYVIDNASEISKSYGQKVQVIHNQNNGGAGGFARGMEAILAEMKVFPATHVVLMDDDVSIEMEVFCRLYALLSYCKDEYMDEIVAGRMFRQDNKTVQYTAAEIWNGGELIHLGFNQDMAKRENLWDMNQNINAQYSGWWFACIPINFIKYNKPLPFFLHCDDVEYGLRHGGTPIILNGIQIWHETHEYRESPIILYYDMRNSLIVNSLYGIVKCQESLLQDWKNKITKYHNKKDYKSEYMIICALRDYLKGFQWFVQQDSAKWHRKICKKNGYRFKNAIMWRITFWLVRKKYWNSYLSYLNGEAKC